MQIRGKIGPDPGDVALVGSDDVEVAAGHALGSTDHQFDALSDKGPADEADLSGSGPAWPGH